MKTMTAQNYSGGSCNDNNNMQIVLPLIYIYILFVLLLLLSSLAISLNLVFIYLFFQLLLSMRLFLPFSSAPSRLDFDDCIYIYIYVSVIECIIEAHMLLVIFSFFYMQPRAIRQNTKSFRCTSHNISRQLGAVGLETCFRFL